MRSREWALHNFHITDHDEMTNLYCALRERSLLLIPSHDHARVHCIQQLISAEMKKSVQSSEISTHSKSQLQIELPVTTHKLVPLVSCDGQKLSGRDVASSH